MAGTYPSTEVVVLERSKPVKRPFEIREATQIHRLRGRRPQEDVGAEVGTASSRLRGRGSLRTLPQVASFWRVGQPCPQIPARDKDLKEKVVSRGGLEPPTR